MSVVSDIEIRLRADIARLRQDLQNARGEVNGALGAMSNAVEKFKGVLGGIAFGAAVGGIASLVKSSIDAVDALNDMSVRTKVAIEDLAGLAYGAKLSDTSLEGVASSITKLGQNIGKDGAKFRELGITATEPLEAFKQLSDIFKDIKDPQQRAAFGAEVLGKSWQEAAVLLDNGAEGISSLIDQGKQLSGVTEQVAADAGKFNDKLDEMGFIAKGVGTRIAADLLPMLNQLVQDFSATGEEVDTAVNKFNPLTEIFRTLIILGGNVGFVLKGIANEIGTWATQIGNYYSAIGQFIDLDFSGGWQTLKATFGKGGIGDQAAASARDARDAFDKWEESWVNVGTAADREAKRAEAAGNEMADSLIKNFTGAGKAAGDSSAKVAAFLNSGEIKAARDKSAAQAEAAAKKEQAAYAGLVASIKEKMDADRLEIAGAAAITPAQQARIKLDQELAAGKLILTDEHKKSAYALLDDARALEKNAAAAKQTRTAIAALADEQDKSYESLVAEAVANENLAATYGKTKLQIAQMTLVRDEDRLSQSQFLDMSESTVAALQREIEVRKRNIAAMGSLDVLDAQKKASEDAAAAQVSFWKSIDDTAHATFVSIANGSKDTAQRLKDTFKNTFFDWLYQMTIKKWVINVQGQLASAGAGSGGVIGAAASALSGGGDGITGTITSLTGIAGALGSVGGIATGALQTAGALLTGQIAVGQTLSAGLAALTSGSAAGAVAGLSSLAGTLGPIALGIAGGVALLKKAFGSGPKTVTGTGLEGVLTPTGATGNTTSTWSKEGGWFSSGKSGTDYTAFTAAQTAAFTDTYKAILDVSKTMGDAVGASTDALATRVQALKVNLTGLKTEAEQLAAVTKFFEGVADAVSTELVPNLAQFQKQGETLSATLERVATDYRNVDDILGAIGKTFGAVGVSSIAAREALLNAAGGMDQLAAGVGYFQQNYYTEAQKLEKTQAEVASSLAAMGLSGLQTTEQFKAAALGIDLTTQAGADMFVQMLALAPAFKEVADAAAAAQVAAKAQADAAIAAAQESAKAAAQAQAERLKANEDVLRAGVNTMYGALERAVAAKKDTLADAYKSTIDGIEAGIAAINTSSAVKRALSDALKNGLVSVSSPAAAGGSLVAGKAQIAQALATAQRTGALPLADSLKDALAAVGRDNSDQFASLLEYQRSVAQTNADISALGGITDQQLTVQDRMLVALNAQKDATTAAYQAQVERLDAVLEYERMQADRALGQYVELVSVNAGIGGVRAAIAALNMGATTSNPTGTGLDINGIYQAVLGRSPDAAGAAFWSKFFGDSIDANDYAEFVKGAKGELAMRGNDWSTNPAYAPAPAPTNPTVDALAVQMAGMQTAMNRTASATTQLAEQFSKVSGNGNALFVETA